MTFSLRLLSLLLKLPIWEGEEERGRREKMGGRPSACGHSEKIAKINKILSRAPSALNLSIFQILPNLLLVGRPASFKSSIFTGP